MPTVRSLQEGQPEQLAPDLRLVLTELRYVPTTGNGELEEPVIFVMGGATVEEVAGDAFEGHD